MDKHHGLNEYVRTFLITFAIIFLIVAGIMTVRWFMMPQTLKQPKLAKSADEMDYYLVDFLIEKNQYLLMRYPKNYAYNIRLGTLYSIKKEYDKAELHFKIAIDKSPYTAYRARYKLATLYLKMGRLPEAQKLMDDVTDKDDKDLIKHKGQVYKEIGIRLYEEGYYALSVTKLEKAEFYLKRVDRKQLKDTHKALAQSYIAVADMYVEQGMPEEAIDALKKADDISEEPEINYKLALLYIDSNPSLAAEYLNVVLKEAPEMLNYYMYYDLLMKISESEGELGNTAARDLFAFKAKKFKKYVEADILYPDDIVMEVMNVKTEHNRKKKLFYIEMPLRMRNNSPFNVKNLTMELVFKEDGHKIHTYDKKIFAYENYFPMGEQTAVITIQTELNTKNLNKHINKIDMEIYLYKNDKHKRLMNTIPIIKPPELFKGEE